MIQEIGSITVSHKSDFIGLSGDTKPLNCGVGSTFYETNTNNNYTFTNGAWVQRLMPNVTIGMVGHDSAINGAPVRIAGRAISTNYTPVSNNDTVDFISTLVGAQIIKPFSIPEMDFNFNCTTTVKDTINLVVKVAGASGIRNYVTSFQYQNISAVATEIVIKDGSVVLWRGYANANMNEPVIVLLNTPLRGTAVTAINFACITTGASVYISVQGYQAP